MYATKTTEQLKAIRETYKYRRDECYARLGTKHRIGDMKGVKDYANYVEEYEGKLMEIDEELNRRGE